MSFLLLSELKLVSVEVFAVNFELESDFFVDYYFYLWFNLVKILVLLFVSDFFSRLFNEVVFCVICFGIGIENFCTIFILTLIVIL